MVVPRPVYRGRRAKALRAKWGRFVGGWSVERLLMALLSMLVLGLVGVFISADAFCPSGTGIRFWEGCVPETAAFGGDGALLGLILFLLALRITRRSTS